MDFGNLDDTELVEALRELVREWQRRFVRRLVVTAELAEIYACQKLDLMRMPSGNRGFDAVDKDGKRYQIKGRAPEQGDVVNPVGTVGRFVNFDFDYALLVILGSDLRPREIWRAKAESLKVEQAKLKNERAGIRVATFQKIGQRIDSYKSHQGKQESLSLSPQSGEAKPVRSRKRVFDAVTGREFQGLHQCYLTLLREGQLEEMRKARKLAPFPQEDNFGYYKMRRFYPGRFIQEDDSGWDKIHSST